MLLPPWATVRIKNTIRPGDLSVRCGARRKLPCAYQKLNPAVFMMEAAKDWCAYDAADRLNGPMAW
jgi:hypothetical protein